MHRAGQKIKAWRQQQQPLVTQAALARMLGISMTQLVRIETYGAIPGTLTALKLEQRGICSVVDFDREPEPDCDGTAQRAAG